MGTQAKRTALYLRVSTDGQTTDNQRLELEAAAASRGWQVVKVYADEGISGAKGRDQRPQLDMMLKDAVRRRFDVVMAWAVDRLGRSLPDLVASMQELHGAKVDLFIHQQALDTTTPSGRAMFGMLGVFSEFERSMIQSRVKAGMDRARKEQNTGMVRRNAQGIALKKIGRPTIADDKVAAIRASLAEGAGIIRVAKAVGVGVGTVQKIKRMTALQAS
jgi:DNA invertase Pin-like site-specific DNA recombinase